LSAEIQRLAQEIENIKQIAVNKEQRLHTLQEQLMKDAEPVKKAMEAAKPSQQNSEAKAPAPQPIGVLMEQQKKASETTKKANPAATQPAG